MSDKILRVNNRTFSAASCEFTADAFPYERIESIDFSRKRTREKVRGINRARGPIGRTNGDVEYGAVTVKFMLDSWDILKTKMTVKGAGSFGDAEIQLALKISEPFKKPVVIAFVDACFAEEKMTVGNDEKALYVDVTFDVMKISANGDSLESFL